MVARQYFGALGPGFDPGMCNYIFYLFFDTCHQPGLGSLTPTSLVIAKVANISLVFF